MSTDERVTKDLIKTLEDGKEGYAKAADRLADTDRADLSDRFREFSAQRERFAEDLHNMAAAYGDDIDVRGTVAGAVHRGWMAVKDALSGDDADAVIDTAEQGEDHAVAEFRRALEETDISPELREVIERMSTEVQAAHDWVRSLRHTV